MYSSSLAGRPDAFLYEFISERRWLVIRPLADNERDENLIQGILSTQYSVLNDGVGPNSGIARCTSELQVQHRRLGISP